MITEFKAGTLYKLSPKHRLYWSELRNPSQCTPADLIFLCTERMHLSGNSPMLDMGDNVPITTLPVHLLIDVDTGGLWDTDPNKQEYEEYLQ